MSDVYDKLLRCYHSVKEKVSFEPQIALILGSGLGDYAEHIQVEAVLNYRDIEGFRFLQYRDTKDVLCLATFRMFLW